MSEAERNMQGELVSDAACKLLLEADEELKALFKRQSANISRSLQCFTRIPGVCPAEPLTCARLECAHEKRTTVRFVADDP
jgi:hypothetical protein